MAHEIKAMKHVFLAPSKVPGRLEMLILINPFRLSVQGKHSIVCDTGSRGLVCVYIVHIVKFCWQKSSFEHSCTAKL